MAKSLISPLVILSFPWLDKPQPAQTEGKPPMYGASFIILADTLAVPAEKARYDAMRQALVEAGVKKFGDRFEALVKTDSFKKGFRKDGEDKGYPAGSVFFNARSQNQPGLVYPHAEPGSNPPKPALVPADKIKSVFYPGAIVRVSVNAFGFDKAGNRGVSFGLNNIQFIKDGARLDNRVAAENEFDVDLTAAPLSADALAEALI